MVDPNRVITLKLNDKFQSFLKAVWKQHPTQKTEVINQAIITLDPGETTGVSEYDGKANIHVYQKVTKEIGSSYDWLAEQLAYLPMAAQKPAHMRYEDYRVYEWKTEDHAWSPVHTIRWIGAIQVASHITKVPSSYIMASHAKAFWTDEKLNMFDLNPKGLKHGRDALRHLLYYICFPDSGTFS